jgi:hypothetical protein
MKNHHKRVSKTVTAGILVLLLASSAFAGINFSDGSTSKTFPTITLKKKTIKFFRKRYERKWTMDTYARLTETSAGTKVNGRTTVKSSFHLLGFTGGVFVDVKDARGNLIYRLSARTNQEASGYENGKYVGWGVNANRSRVKSWEVMIPPEISLIGKTVDIYQIRTKKKIDWNKTKAKFNEIAKNLGKAIKEFFDNHGDDVVILAVKYGPKINEMNVAAKAGTLQFSEVCDVMNSILTDARAYDMISSTKAQNLINIISAVKEIESNGKNGWAPKNQEMIVALIQDITVAISEKNISDATLTRIVNNFEAFLNDKSGLVGANLQPIETILVNTKGLIKEKLNTQQIAMFDTVIDFVSKINDYGQDPLLQQEKLNCIFAAARAIVDIRANAIAGILTADFIHEKLVTFLDVNYLVLGLTETQNDAIENIIGSTVNMINNSGEGFLPENQKQIVNLIISIEQIAASKPLNYNLINTLVNDLEKLCGNKGEFTPSSLLDIEIILTNAHTLIAPKLKENSKVEDIFTTAITIVSAVNNWGEVPITNNLGVVFNGLRLAIDLLEQGQNKTITVEYAEIQFNNWYIELDSVLKEAYPNKAEQIDAVKAIIDNTFAIIKNGKEGWDFDHWNAVADIVKAGFEVIQTENQFKIMFTLLELKADFEVLLENKGGFIADNGQYIENIIEGLYILSADNEKIYDALSSLIKYLEDYNSWNNEQAA